MAALHLERIPRFPKLHARHGQRLIACSHDNLDVTSAAPPAGLQRAVFTAIQNELIMRALEKNALNLVVGNFRLPRPFRLVHLRIKKPLGCRDAQSCPASAGNGDRVVKAVVVIQFEQHPTDGIGRNGQRTLIPSQMFSGQIVCRSKRLPIIRAFWNRPHMPHSHAGNRTIKLRRDDGREQQMRTATVFHHRRSDFGVLKRKGIRPSFAAAGFVAPRKFPGIQCHGTGCLKFPMMFTHGKTRQEFARPRSDAGRDEWNHRRIGTGADHQPVRQGNLGPRTVCSQHQHAGNQHVLAGGERDFERIEIPVLLVAERRPASQRPTVEEKLIPFVRRDVQTRGYGLGGHKPTAERHLCGSRDRERWLHPPGRPSVDTLAHVVCLSRTRKWIFVQRCLHAIGLFRSWRLWQWRVQISNSSNWCTVWPSIRIFSRTTSSTQC